MQVDPIIIPKNASLPPNISSFLLRERQVSPTILLITQHELLLWPSASSAPYPSWPSTAHPCTNSYATDSICILQTSINLVSYNSTQKNYPFLITVVFFFLFGWEISRSGIEWKGLMRQKLKITIESWRKFSGLSETSLIELHQRNAGSHFGNYLNGQIQFVGMLEHFIPEIPNDSWAKN